MHSSENSKNPAHDRFFVDKFSESDSSFGYKDPIYSTKVMPHLRGDNMFHTNSEKNVGYIKTSNGNLITYVPVKDEEPIQINNNNNSVLRNSTNSMSNLKKSDPYNYYDGNHLKIKRVNPLNQLRRNASQITHFFS